jgi:hypothetical protein
MTDRNVPSSYSTIRQAISASLTGDSIIIAAGSWSITDGGPPTLAFAAGPNIYSISGFTSATQWLAFSGAGNDGDASTTTITGNSRLFVDNSDGDPPTKIDIRNLDFLYSGASGYILQTGSFGQLTGATPSEIFLDNLSFRGTHAGAGSATSNPFGNFGAVLGFQKFTFSNSTVSLNQGSPTVQASFNGTQAVSGGSSFLMLQGGIGTGNNLTIDNVTFNESGFRNGISIFDSKNVEIKGASATSGTSFFRSDPLTRYARRRIESGQEVFNVGNKIKDSQALIYNTSFYDGSYLVVEKTFVDATNSVTIGSSSPAGARNNFSQFDTAKSPIPNPIIEGGAVGIVLQGSQASTAVTNLVNNTFRYVAPVMNNTSSAAFNLTGSGNVYINPVNDASTGVQRYWAGGTGNDTITGSTISEVFTPGRGSDTVDTGNSTSTADFVIFNTPIAAGGDIDIITNFNRNPSSLALDRIILDRKYFPGITATFNGATASTIGAVDASNITNLPAALTPATRLIYNPTNGSLSYDSDGSGPSTAIPFARIYTSTTTTGAGIPSLIGFNGSNLTSVNIGII